MGMMINRRKGLLPSGYKQLEYIENTSNAYIDTNYFVNGKTITECSFYAVSLGYTTVSVIYARRDVNGSNCIYIGFSQQRSLWLYGSYITHNKLSPISMNVWHNVKTIGGEYYFDGVLTAKYTDKDFTTTTPLPLFAEDDADRVIKKYFIGRMSMMRISSETGIERNFIPCINPNNVVGMYDTVGKQFYSSPNGTAFIAGPEV